MTNDWENQLAVDQKKMEIAGWTYVDTLGVVGPWATTFNFESSTADAIKAGWTVKGIPSEKRYKQDRYLYYVQGYLKSDGDSFVMMFRREKPKFPMGNP
jgi:hypothetical protein